MAVDKTKLLIQTIGFIVAGLIIICITFIVLMTTLRATTKSSVTHDDIMQVEAMFCAKYGMERQSKIQQACSFFGCQDKEVRFCTDGLNERTIDYDDDMFCKVSMYDKIIGC